MNKFGEEKVQPVMKRAASGSDVLTRDNIKSARWRKRTFDGLDLDHTDAAYAVFRLCTFNRLSAVKAHFCRAVFENCEARGADFSGTDFSGASMTDSDLSRSNFESANLTDVDASFCKLQGADFRSAVLTNTSFCDTDLRGADFSGAVIDNTDFRGADIRGAQFDEAVIARLFARSEEPKPPVELVNALAPLVADLLKRAGKTGVIDDGAWQAELDATLRRLGADSLNRDLTGVWDEQLGQWLQQAGNIGVNQLLDALRVEGDKAPGAVASLLEGLTRDLGLAPGASTEELLSTLLLKLKKS